ncbi:MAG: Glycosyl transferase, group 1 [Parcubacteria group bacterium GW2011_GWA1_47_8]|nr:MAG: Glycosyl transferase, group 1 [Parcubacteria group bacterium GW2011_GWA1_47_8]
MSIMQNILRRYLLAYRNKITNKLFGRAFIPHQGKKKGVVLLSFLTGPFTLAPGEFYTDPHSNNWASPEIARLFSERGYDVDVINWDNDRFIPRKKYAVCIDMQYNLERLSPYLPKNCIKVMHLVASYPEFQNNAEQARIRALEKRRGVVLAPSRTSPATSNPGIADFLLGYGNKTVHGTYSRFRKQVIPVPVPIMEKYDFPHDKNFEESKKHFLWFGGGGAVLKGLDLVLDVLGRQRWYRRFGLAHGHAPIPAVFDHQHMINLFTTCLCRECRRAPRALVRRAKRGCPGWHRSRRTGSSDAVEP